MTAGAARLEDTKTMTTKQMTRMNMLDIFEVMLSDNMVSFDGVGEALSKRITVSVTGKRFMSEVFYSRQMRKF